MPATSKPIFLRPQESRVMTGVPVAGKLTDQQTLFGASEAAP